MTTGPDPAPDPAPGPAPGPVVGRGRTSHVFGLDDARVLRRTAPGVDVSGEAAAMRHAAAHGVPVPQVHSVHGQDMVLERVHGVTMLTALAEGTCAPVDGAQVLVDLLVRLRAVPPRPGAAPGAALVHLDLHPDNVMLGGHGPVLVDWTNARDDDPDLDPAMSALILAENAVAPGPLAGPAHELLRLVVGAAGARGLDPVRRLDGAAALRTANPMLTPAEHAAVGRAVRLVRAVAVAE